jgi:hypothetical protein
MNDHTNTYPDLVNVEDWLNAKGYTGEAGACHQAMSLIRSQEKRIAELRKEADMMHSEYKTAAARIAALNEEVERYRQRWLSAESVIDVRHDRIAELEVPLCIGRRTIGIMAEEGMWQSEDGRAVVAADELFRQDPYARIAELTAALKPFAEQAQYFEGYAGEYKFVSMVKPNDLRAARAALGEKE